MYHIFFITVTPWKFEGYEKIIVSYDTHVSIRGLEPKISILD